MVYVVIPTYKSQDDIRNLLFSLKAQTIPNEVVIIDSSSPNSIVKSAQFFGAKVVTVAKQHFDHGTTRNFGVAQTNSEFVIFLTQDAIPADKYMIAELIRPMQADPKIAMCYGRQLPRPNARPLERSARQFNYPPQSILKTKSHIDTLGLKAFFCSNSCSAVRSSTFNELGGFKNNVIVNEDMLFAAKAILQGYSVYYSAAAKVYHSHPYPLSQTFKRYFNIGRFFADNKWILNVVGLKSYGVEMLKSGVKTFWEKRAPHYIVAFLIELAVKTIACKLGWYYQLLFHKKHDNCR